MRVTANAPMVSLRIDDQPVPLRGQSREATLELAESRRGNAARVQAVADDGRVSALQFVVGDRDVSLEFPGVRPGKTSTTVTRPPPIAPTVSPIPASPYKKVP